jgi:hypothetical protein
MLDIREDDDFAGHEPVSEEALEEFTFDPMKGPDIADLHFDVKAGMRSEWNKKALQIMQAEFCKQLDEEYESVPVRSTQYLEESFRERFQRLANVWKRAQPQLTSGGALESHEAVERRMIEDKDIELKCRRHTTRRINVSSTRYPVQPSQTVISFRNTSVGSRLWNA